MADPKTNPDLSKHALTPLPDFFAKAGENAEGRVENPQALQEAYKIFSALHAEVCSGGEDGGPLAPIKKAIKKSGNRAEAAEMTADLVRPFTYNQDLNTQTAEINTYTVADELTLMAGILRSNKADKLGHLPLEEREKNVNNVRQDASKAIAAVLQQNAEAFGDNKNEKISAHIDKMAELLDNASNACIETSNAFMGLDANGNKLQR